MKLTKVLKMSMAAIMALAMLPGAGHSQDRASNEAGDVQLEMVGQVTNATVQPRFNTAISLSLMVLVASPRFSTGDPR